MKIYAKCPPTKCEYLTGGKEYEVLDDDGKLFRITDNAGDKVVENWINGLHAKGSWERIIREDVVDNTPTLRDEFAMSALTGFLSNPDGYRQSMLCAGLPNDESMAHDAYKIADAMMEARKS